MNLTSDDRPSLTDAIMRAEQKTGAEIVLVVKPASGRYADIHALAGVVAATLGLLFMLFSEWEFDALHVVPMMLGLGVSAALLSSVCVPRFGPRRRSARQVEDAAHAEFSRHGVHRTEERIGILVYYSHAERTGRMLFDSGVARELDAKEREAWRARLQALRTAGDLIALIDEMGDRLGHVLPRGADDQNELDDRVA